MNLRFLAAALLLLFITSSGISTAADRPSIGTATAASEDASWCLTLGWMYTPGFIPNGVQVNMDFTQDLLSASQGIIAIENGDLAIGECVGLGTLTEAWKKGARSAVIVAVNGESPAYVLIGSKNVKRLADLKGKTVANNGLQTTATQAVIAMLQRGANLMPDRDYSFVASGSAAARTAALMAGKLDAIPAVPPFSYQLLDQGFPLLAVEKQYVPNYVQGTLVVNRDWAEKNRAQLVAILKTMLVVGRWMKDPAQKNDVIAKMANNVMMAGHTIGPDYARRMYADVVAVNGGVVEGGYADRAMFMSSYRLLTERGLLDQSDYPPLDKIVDYSYLNEARRELGMPVVKPLTP